MATPAKSCSKALKDATARWPTRDRASDGIMGDAAHQARKSDHNLGNAFDLTHDPTDGPDCHELSQLVINDPRVTYVIWTGKIFKRRIPAAGWQPYTGQNPHNHHMHVSIRDESRDDLAAWPWSPGEELTGGSSQPATGGTTPFPGTALRQDSKGDAVRTLQQRLNALGNSLTVDGNFGPATKKAVVAFQAANGLTADGIVGPQTWAALFAG
jgi:hypothetical protein